MSHRESVTARGIDRFLPEYSQLVDTDDSLINKLSFVNLGA